ncbi:hypothetical protein WA538_003653 [Blastocystis sp. DL]
MEEYNITDVSQIYTYVIHSLLDSTEVNRKYPDSSLFSCYDDPGLSLQDFFNRLFRTMSCSLECYFISLIYIQRLHDSNHGLIANSSIKNVITASMVLAQKFFDEICFKSEFYAGCANLTVSQLNSLEVDFLCRIHFTLMVYPAQYQTFYNHMRSLCQVPILKAKGVTLPEIVNICPTSDCPLLKYVLSPQEQQRKAMYYKHPIVSRPPPPIIYKPKPMMLIPPPVVYPPPRPFQPRPPIVVAQPTYANGNGLPQAQVVPPVVGAFVPYPVQSVVPYAVQPGEVVSVFSPPGFYR